MKRELPEFDTLCDVLLKTAELIQKLTPESRMKIKEELRKSLEIENEFDLFLMYNLMSSHIDKS